MTRAHKHQIRIATLCVGLAPAFALAHPGHGEHASWEYAVGFLLSAGLVAAGVAATRLVTRAVTAAARRSPT